MGITIKQIAELCGVSIGTVDRALNDRPGISEKTKRRILEVAREHQYRPDLTARSLARGRTMTIGVVLFDLYNRSFAQLANAIERRSRERGYIVHLTLTGKDPEMEKNCLRQLVQRKADGIILCSVNEGARFEEELRGLLTPIVTVCNRISDRWPYVGIDDRGAMKEAVGQLLRKGYRRFVYVCPPLADRGRVNIHTQEQRWIGFREALEDGADAVSGGQGKFETAVIAQRDYLDALRRLDLAAGTGKTAIVCSCDAYALEVMHDCRSRGLRVPEDVGIMGFDNIDMLKYVSPRLSTVHYDMEEFGTRAADSLIAWIERGEAPSVPSLAYRWIEGESV
ncbi:LacI family DNA-binding transcriptional regulator [Paenibacillus thermoaerophilus]|uniref:LacI family DNA-binding transcriptional regulator n=1 Tax=Paenibacillus thermoaerophilus TaxID=1215385 RepID=A0ABW2UZ58_9BACL|nr:LacI family DNA-binding transcriptional regulator [Paenibacillus thermoaerophilus]TMV17462.1 LacI family transcriptional regulator [Paenibacillus thermoaerophilus]